VVLHDLRNPERSIVAIANGHVTHRRVGGPVVGGPTADKAFRLLREGGPSNRSLLNYRTITRDGRELKSTSLVYYSRFTGQPIVALCLNYDLTGIQGARSALDTILRLNAGDELPAQEPAEPRGPADIDAIVRTTIDHIIGSTGKPVALMEKEEKSSVVAALDETGVFMIRGSVDRVARALAVSRFTIYNYLKQVRTLRKDTKTSGKRSAGARGSRSARGAIDTARQ
jgi:predicted transcriptional regulator YheO